MILASILVASFSFNILDRLFFLHMYEQILLDEAKAIYCCHDHHAFLDLPHTLVDIALTESVWKGEESTQVTAWFFSLGYV